MTRACTILTIPCAGEFATRPRPNSHLRHSRLDSIITTGIDGCTEGKSLLRLFPIAWFVGLAAVALVACSSEATPAANPSQNEPTSAVAAPDTRADDAPQGLVAEVNGVGITRERYERALTRSMALSNVASQEALEQEVLNTLIEQELIIQAAPDLGVVVTDEQVQAEMAALRDLAQSEEEWQQYLELNGYSEEEMFEAQRESLITQGVRDALMAEYEGDVLQVNARHIVVRTRAEAEEVLDRLDAGEGFATLAAEYSIDTSTQNSGGNLGWFAPNELFYRSLEEVAFDLEPGQMAGPIVTSLGYHILQVLDRAEMEIDPPERLRIISQTVFENWLQEQLRNATVERYL